MFLMKLLNVFLGVHNGDASSFVTLFDCDVAILWRLHNASLSSAVRLSLIFYSGVYILVAICGGKQEVYDM